MLVIKYKRYLYNSHSYKIMWSQWPCLIIIKGDGRGQSQILNKNYFIFFSAFLLFRLEGFSRVAFSPPLICVGTSIIIKMSAGALHGDSARRQQAKWEIVWKNNSSICSVSQVWSESQAELESWRGSFVSLFSRFAQASSRKAEKQQPVPVCVCVFS